MVKTISTRIAQKHDFEVNWLANTDVVPFAGEMIVYDSEVDDKGNTITMVVNGETVPVLPKGRTVPYTYPRIKMGDGFTNVVNLPFCSAAVQFVTWEDDDV